MTGTGELPVVVVLGMHRSGTSALAGALVRLGLHAGRDPELLAPAPDNPRGFFERSDTVALNDVLLAEHALAALSDRLRAERCDEPGFAAELGWVLGAFAPRAVGVTGERYAHAIDACMAALRDGAGPACGLLLKDPRLSLTWPAWRPRAGRCVVLVAVRSPAAVVDSLARRDAMPAALAELLWTRYTRAAIEASEGLPRMLVDYDTMLASAPAMVDTLADFLAGNGVAIDDAGRETAAAFLSPKLRHAADRASTGECGALYDTLLAAAPEVATLGGADRPPEPLPELEFYQALRVILSRRLVDERHRGDRGDRARMALQRVEAHVVSGAVVRGLRRLKRDPGFGAP